MATGIVKWYSAEKGFGFISRSDGDDVYMPKSAVLGEAQAHLQIGERVEFDIFQGSKGLEARDVRPMS